MIIKFDVSLSVMCVSVLYVWVCSCLTSQFMFFNVMRTSSVHARTLYVLYELIHLQERHLVTTLTDKAISKLLCVKILLKR